MRKLFKKRFKKRLGLTLMASFLLAGCVPIESSKQGEFTVPKGELVRYEVDSKLYDCVGVGPQKCLRVKRGGSDEWTFFYSQIEGFEYQEGYRYQLLVDEFPLEPIPDRSAVGYRLMRELERLKVVHI